MSARSFLDSNVLVYTDDGDSPVKRARALDLFQDLRQSRRGVISTQVLGEYFSVATRKLGVGPQVARRKVELFARLDLVLIDAATILKAIDLHRLRSLSWWDSLIVCAALEANCRVLFSEDLHPGRIEGLEVINPFVA
ncbi:MAG TPA: PIN domain-containing protein [Thermoanaerobaculia bacterium]|nr:PIN domain-containing protein [Thermoanaerobaculia bacterium]